VNNLRDICESPELATLPEWPVLRDSSINSFGFVESAIDRRIVFAESQLALATALHSSGVGAVITLPMFADEVRASGRGVVVADTPRRRFVEAHNWLAAHTNFYGEPCASRIDASAYVATSAHVDEFGVVVGPGCRLEARSVVLAGTELGAGVIVQAGAVLGALGFQCMRFSDAVIDCIHVGQLRIADRVVVMANAVVAKAVFRQATTIGADCRIGNNAFVSHNCQVGERCLIGHGAVIAGNCVIGQRTVVGPGVTCADRIVVGNDATLTMGAVVTKNVAPHSRVTGNFAVPHDVFKSTTKG
jgi:UDP-3-O-[3-hydroxymyristoyl] glucosamine N-acyltransferase